MVGQKGREGLQLDIVIDRADKSVNICECKYYAEAYEVSKQYAKLLKNRKELFIHYTGTKKNVFTTLICNQQVKKNDAFYESVDRLVLLEELF